MERNRTRTSPAGILDNRTKVAYEGVLLLNGNVDLLSESVKFPSDESEKQNEVEQRKSFVPELIDHLAHFERLASSEKKEIYRQYSSKPGFCRICQKQYRHMYLHWMERHAFFKDVIQCLEPSCLKLLNYRKSDLFRHMQSIHHWTRVKSVAMFAKLGRPFPIPRHFWIKYKQLRHVFIAGDISKSVAHNPADGGKVVASSSATIEKADESNSIPPSKTAEKIGQHEPGSSGKESVPNILTSDNIRSSVCRRVSNSETCNYQHSESISPSLGIQSKPQPNHGEVQPNFGEAHCSVEEAQPQSGESPLSGKSELVSGQSSSILTELQPLNLKDRSVCDESECAQSGTSNLVTLQMKFGISDLQDHCAIIKALATNHVPSDWEQATAMDINKAISAMRDNLHQMEAILFAWKEKINLTNQHLLWAQNLLSRKMTESSWSDQE